MIWVGVVDVGLDLHGDFGLQHAAAQEEAVLIGMGDGEGPVEVAFVVEVRKGEESYDVGSVEDATGRRPLWVAVQIHGQRRLKADGLEESLVGEEEEA